MRKIAKWSGALGVSVSVLVVFLMVLSAFNGVAAPQKSEVSYQIGTTDVQVSKTGHGMLKVAMQDDMKTLNTVIAQDVWDWNVLGWVMDGPVNRQKVSRKPFPWMAESWEYDPADPLHATMTLKKGIYWTDHDFDTYGEDFGVYAPTDDTPASADPAGYHEVTAYDMVFTYNLLKDAPRYQNAIDPLRIDDKGDNDPSNDVLGVTVVDRYTIAYELVKPTSDLVMDIISFSIWPEHIWSAHQDDKLTWQPEISDVVFSGMFIIDEWVKGSYVTLRTNTHYFNKSAIPNIDGILFRIYTNTDAAILALESGEVDFIAWTIQPGYIPQIQENPDLEIAQTKEMGFFYTSYNFRNPAFGYDSFNDPDRVDVGKPLRRAIAHCINKEKIVLNLLQGKGTVGDSVVSPANSNYYNTSVRTYPFDPAKAQAILEAAGYYKAGGVYVSPNGDPIDGPGGDGVIDIIHPPADYDPVRAEAARMIADQMNEIGIPAKNTPVDFGTLVQKTNNHDFEMYLLGWAIGGEDAGYLWDFFRSDPRDTIGGYNSPGYRNASYDAIVDQMVEELDVDKRIELAKRAQGVIAEDLVYNVLYYRDNIEAYRTSTYKSGWWRQTGGVFNQWTIMGLKTTESVDYSVNVDGKTKISGPETYTVTILDENQAPLDGATIYIEVTNGVAEPSSGVSGDDGAGKFTFTFTPDVPASGANPVTAVIKALVDYEATDGIGSMQVTVMPADAFWLETSSEFDIAMPVDFEDSKLGIPFSVRVKDPNDGWLSNALVEVSVSPDEGDFDSTSQSTGIDGLAEFYFTPPTTLTENTMYTITADVSYDKDGTTYTETETLVAEVLVSNKKMLVQMDLDKTSVYTGDEVTITVTVLDKNTATPVDGAEVTITTDAGGTVTPATATTTASGQVTFTFSSDAAATYTLTATATKAQYDNAQNSEIVTVKTEQTTSKKFIPAAGIVGGISVLVLVALAIVLLKKREL